MKSFRERRDLANFRLLQSFLHLQHAVVLAGLGISEVICFQALRKPSMADYWTTVIELAITACVGSLIFSPALVYLTDGAFSGWLAARIGALNTRIFVQKIQIFKLRRSKRRLETIAGNLLKALEERAAERRNLLTQIEDRIIALDPTKDYEIINELYIKHHEGLRGYSEMMDSIARRHAMLDTETLSESNSSETPRSGACNESEKTMDYRLFDPEFHY